MSFVKGAFNRNSQIPEEVRTSNYMVCRAITDQLHKGI